MDEIELLVEQTYRHFHERFPESDLISPSEILGMRGDWEFNLPDGPGIIYHLQKTKGLFVLRTLVSKNIKYDLSLIIESPENYPTLRLVEIGQAQIQDKLRFFEVEDSHHAEMIHHQVSNRRFPIDEETLCNISDPGFSWWLRVIDKGFQLSFNLAHNEEQKFLKLGPLGDQKVAIKQFGDLFNELKKFDLDFESQLDQTKISVMGEEDLIIKDFILYFEEGIIGDTLKHLFKLLAKSNKDLSSLESLWFYLQELSSMRRFWIHIQKDVT
jgi:hypothetical protein